MDLSKHDNITILGFGVEGKSFYKYYRSLFPEKRLYITDQNSIEIDDLNVEIRSGESYLHIPSDSTLVVKSPGIPISQIDYDDEKTTVTTVTNLFLSIIKGTVIGVTGTKGKSTTSKLIYEILRSGGKDVYLLGNIGECSLDYLDKDTVDTFYVYEMSSYQCETLIESPHIAVLLNIFPEHISYHGSCELYKEAKYQITKYQDKTDYCIQFSGNELAKTNATTILFDANDENALAHVENDQYIFDGEVIGSIRDTQLRGKHQQQNILAAICVAKVLNISNEDIMQRVRNMQPLEYRLEYVENDLGIDIVDDTLATIPQATIAALESIENVQTLIIGGMNRGEEIDYSELSAYINTTDIKTIIAFPETGKKVIRNIQKDIEILETDDMQRAVEFSIAHTQKGKAILHSPGASSFNLFKNYKERSQQFRDAIKTYERNHKRTN